MKYLNATNEFICRLINPEKIISSGMRLESKKIIPTSVVHTAQHSKFI